MTAGAPPPDEAAGRLRPLPPLGEVIARHGLRADRRLGQHFLLDPALLARIARAAGDLTGRTVLEVGPGPGGLTRALLDAGAARVVAVERDPRCVAALAELRDRAGERLTVIEADALAVDEAALGPPPPFTVVANLPYNIATALLLKWLGRPELFDSFTVMVQREVADRLTAAPRTKAYGRLSVAVQWRSEVRRLYDLPARAFVPPPRVVSSLVRLVPRRPGPLAEADPAALEAVVAAAFGQRRKMLRAALRGLVADPDSLLAAAGGLSPTARAEELDVAAFCALARAWAALPPTAAGRGTGGRTRSGPAGGGGAAARP